MSTPSAKLMVFASGQLACIKIIGRANFTSSIDFKTVVNELLQKGFSCFILDLTDCLLMDSTFLGVLAGFGLKATAPSPEVPDGTPNGRAIELLNPNTRIAELLENLGVIHLFKVVNGTFELPKEASTHIPPPVKTTRDEVTLNCLEAHKTLMEISPANVPRFKDVAQFLTEDLKRNKTGS
ncbi:STAS domain-containing protein [Pedosphaera parvula]|uniref:Anti-sigma-factor antagonist n=1 Tax=Pedosphaera parvula (strain Ellin514) TaxID=320771 RepID=B9XNK5_PEDPL|nr:STAS domain-containing protein [Pedosphaera parvula]EEF58545.1 anti-sigma-factor antagonist [Pedosphaera parvula Ellin514]